MELKILGLNFDIQWKNKLLNYQRIENQFKNENADIFLLPEMFSTGFCMDAQEIADRNHETLTWMKSFAETKNAVVAGSVSEEENGKYFNRFYFVKPDGTFEFYDKRHLFSYSGEDKIYTAGKERKILIYKNFRILLQVCYDLRFPVFSRNNDDYDLAIYVANWPKIRIEAWKHLLRARAIENQSYVFGLNRIGTDGNTLKYEKSSYCFFADGTEISEKKGDLVSAEIRLENLKNFREKFRFLEDRDGFEIL
jgi:predicted amidohydrolase